MAATATSRPIHGLLVCLGLVVGCTSAPPAPETVCDPQAPARCDEAGAYVVHCNQTGNGWLIVEACKLGASCVDARCVGVDGAARATTPPRASDGRASAPDALPDAAAARPGDAIADVAPRADAGGGDGGANGPLDAADGGEAKPEVSGDALPADGVAASDAGAAVPNGDGSGADGATMADGDGSAANGPSDALADALAGAGGADAGAMDAAADSATTGRGGPPPTP